MYVSTCSAATWQVMEGIPGGLGLVGVALGVVPVVGHEPSPGGVSDLTLAPDSGVEPARALPATGQGVRADEEVEAWRNPPPPRAVPRGVGRDVAFPDHLLLQGAADAYKLDRVSSFLFSSETGNIQLTG